MPEKIIKSLAQEIILEITMLEGKGQVDLLTGDFKAYETVKEILFDIGKILKIDISKYGVMAM